MRVFRNITRGKAGILVEASLLRICLTSLLQLWLNKLAKALTYQACYKSVVTIWEQPVRTHPVEKLLMQTCYKSATGLLEAVCFYVCTTWSINKPKRNS